jgi:hypothetical protein
MMTLASPSLPLSGLVTARRHSWSAALAEALIYAMVALLLGAHGLDPEFGVRVESGGRHRQKEPCDGHCSGVATSRPTATAV